MLEFEEYRLKLQGLEEEIRELGESIGLERLKEEISRLDEQAASPDFWNDVEQCQKLLQKSKRAKDKLAEYEALVSRWEDARVLVDLAISENDPGLLGEIKKEYEAVVGELERQRIETLLSGEFDKNNAIMTLHAGAGGLEAQDWALMLYRMYTRWAERKGFKVKTIDMIDGEGAGIKSAVMIIEGENAYGYTKSEAGVHRLVRISPFDASGRRHTSFASVEVTPEISEEVEVNIRDEDIKVDTYRSSGAGGQHVNKTESAVRITHIPTGIVVACQNERSQHQNREVAMRMLKSKLIEIKQRENYERIEDIKGEQKEITWGSQIRSYVFMPYTLVKDHRSGYETGDVNAVMDGDLDGFINAYLKAASLGSLNKK